VRRWLEEREFCVFDLETTGFSPKKGARIIEVGGVLLRGGRVDADFHELVDPGRSIPAEITRLTGLTDDDVAGAPPPDRVLTDFTRFAGDDLTFLRHYHPDPPRPDCIDTLRLARRLLSLESHSLDALVEHLGIERTRSHRGLEDARATATLFMQLLERVEDPRDVLGHGVPPALVEGPRTSKTRGEPERAILEAAAELSTAVGVNKLAGILAGSERQDLERYRSLRAYGRLSGHPQTELRERIEKLLERGLLEQSPGRYPTLSLSREGASRLTSS